MIDSAKMIPAGNFPSINILLGSHDTLPMTDAEQRAMSIIDRWHILFNAFSFELIKRSWYENSNPPAYIFDYEKKFNGELNPTGMNSIRITVGHDGTTIFYTNCAPTFIIPPLINISKERALKAVEGKILRYYDWTGVQSDTISSRSVTVSTITIALIPRYYAPVISSYMALTSIEYRRCWQLTTTVFQVYVDAITGQDLDFAQQYIIFRTATPWVYIPSVQPAIKKII